MGDESRESCDAIELDQYMNSPPSALPEGTEGPAVSEEQRVGISTQTVKISEKLVNTAAVVCLSAITVLLLGTNRWAFYKS